MGRRNTKAAYKAAYIAEHKAYKAAGRDGDAKTVAGILRDSFGHDVDGGSKPTAAGKPAAKPETAASSKPPENAAAARADEHVCDVKGCGFKAKTAAGLANHERSHEDDSASKGGRK